MNGLEVLKDTQEERIKLAKEIQEKIKKGEKITISPA